MKTDIELFKEAILQGNRPSVLSMIDSKPYLLNSIEPKGSRPMICVFLIANTEAPTDFLLYPLTYSEIDWSLKDIHATILSIATSRIATSLEDILDFLKKNKHFMNGDGTKTIQELSVENQNKYEKQFGSALKTTHRNKVNIIELAQKKLDAATFIVESLSAAQTNIIDNAPSPFIHQNHVQLNNNAVKENTILSNNSNIQNYLNIFAQYKNISDNHTQQQNQIAKDAAMQKLAQMRNAHRILMTTPNSNQAQQQLTTLIAECEKDIAKLTM